MNTTNILVAEFFLRCFAGILFFFQGYDKLFNVKMPSVIDTFMVDASRYHVPRWFVGLVAYYSSITECIGGLLLMLGLFTNYSLYALGLDILIVTFAFSFLDPMWDLKYVFPRFLLVVTLLLLPQHCNFIGLDALVFNK